MFAGQYGQRQLTVLCAQCLVLTIDPDRRHVGVGRQADNMLRTASTAVIELQFDVAAAIAMRDLDIDGVESECRPRAGLRPRRGNDKLLTSPGRKLGAASATAVIVRIALRHPGERNIPDTADTEMPGLCIELAFGGAQHQRRCQWQPGVPAN